MQICPFCDSAIAETAETVKEESLGFNYYPHSRYSNEKQHYTFIMILCPRCEGTSYKIKGEQEPYSKYGEIPIYPRSRAVKFPIYIPEQLRQDYEEAYSILDLSPKASATLSRRCLQGIIRNFHDVKPANLYNEIKQLEGKIPASQYNVLHSLRQIGNIGAHLEDDVNLIVDINKDEAEKLIKLLEHLFKVWYIDHHETENLYSSINAINDEKKEIKKTKNGE